MEADAGRDFAGGHPPLVLTVLLLFTHPSARGRVALSYVHASKLPHREALGVLNPDLLLYAYRTGLFPMADPDEDDQIYWYAPDPRAVMPLDTFHVPHNTAKRVRQQAFEVVADRAFEATIRACAAPARGRMTTWISEEIISAYCELHRLGYAHSVEAWQDGRLVGGLYGVALRGAFFGESMFHRARDASKVALVHLVARLRRGGFSLLDTQLQTEHLARFGNAEVSREEYERRLDQALRVNTARWDVDMTGWTDDVRHGGFAAGS